MSSPLRMSTRARTLFYGTPEISVKSLRALSRETEVVGVICQPDRPQGRGLTLTPPPVKRAALELGLEVFQPERVRDGRLLQFVESARADVAVVIAYGRILPLEVLSAPRLGSVNLHASLLPALRGAAPIQRALMLGLDKTGVCLMQMDAGLDTGPILSAHELAIDEGDDAATLAHKIGELAAEVVRLDVPRFLSGELTPTPQDDSRATYAPPIENADTRLDVNQAARSLQNQIRGLSPKPGAVVLVHRSGEAERRLKILAGLAVASPPSSRVPGTVWVQEGRPLIETGEGSLEVLLGQLEGRKVVRGADLVNGRALLPGDLVS
jgi:methionyl-tRNA formyltransferase